MKDSLYLFQQVNYTVRPVQTDSKVILFKVLKQAHSTPLLELQLLYGWVDKKLVELTARNDNNTVFMDACSNYIISKYQLK